MEGRGEKVNIKLRRNSLFIIQKMGGRVEITFIFFLLRKVEKPSVCLKMNVIEQ